MSRASKASWTGMLNSVMILVPPDCHFRALGPKGLNWEHPPCTERQSLNQECGWKDGDRGGPARTEGIHRKEKRKKRKTHLTHTGLLMEGTDRRVISGKAVRKT
jgi:hypothetical protein